MQQPRLTRRQFTRRALKSGVFLIAAPNFGCNSQLATHGTFHGEMNMGDRVVFVCQDSGGNCSPGVYMHVGGESALELLQEAAPHMRAKEIGDAAAGLCGFICSMIPDAAAGGYVSLFDSPPRSDSGSIDWDKYTHGDAGVVVVNVDDGSVTCHAGYLAGQTLDNLPLADT